jgi:hypothetical protein
MKPREIPRAIPDRHPYFRIDLEGHGSHAMRVPSPTMSGVVLGLVEESKQRAETLKKLADDSSRRRAGSDVGEVFALYGATVGLCWSHETLDLETPAPADIAPAAVLAYGRAVCDELHEGGYTTSDVALLWVQALGKLASGYADMRSTLEAAGFFAGRRGSPSGSSDSPLAGDSATPSPGSA